jgi:hypothetical protein
MYIQHGQTINRLLIDDEFASLMIPPSILKQLCSGIRWLEDFVAGRYNAARCYQEVARITGSTKRLTLPEDRAGIIKLDSESRSNLPCLTEVINEVLRIYMVGRFLQACDPRYIEDWLKVDALALQVLPDVRQSNHPEWIDTDRSISQMACQSTHP